MFRVHHGCVFHARKFTFAHAKPLSASSCFEIQTHTHECRTHARTPAGEMMLVLVVLALPLTNGLRTATISSKSTTSSRSAAVRMDAAVGSPIEMTVDLPPRGKAKLRFKRLLPSSEGIVVKYSLPCALNVENRDGRAVCTKDGAGGEKVGDVLRYCTQWTLGLPSGDGAITTAASFAGAISWQLGLFDGTVAYPSCADVAHN